MVGSGSGLVVNLELIHSVELNAPTPLARNLAQTFLQLAQPARMPIRGEFNIKWGHRPLNAFICIQFWLILQQLYFSISC